MKLAKMFVQDQDSIRCKGVYGNSVCTYLQELSNISRKETAKIFTKWVPKKHTSSFIQKRIEMQSKASGKNGCYVLALTKNN